MHPVVNKGKFAILTAEAPMGPTAPGGNKALAQELQQAGYKFEPTVGRYSSENDEHGFLVHNPDFEHIKSLGKKYGQESVILSQGGQHQMHYTHHPELAGKAITGSGHQVFASPPGMFFTTVHHAGKPLHFTLNFDWDKPPVDGSANPPQPLQKSEPQKFLVHYSTTKGLKELDPNYMGTSAVKSSENKYGVPEIRRTYFYREGTVPEEIVTSQAKTKYFVPEPHPSKLYDLAKDEGGHLERARQELAEGKGVGSLSDRALGAIKSAGYSGFFNSGSALPNVVAMFHTTPVVHEEPAPAVMYGKEGQDWMAASVPPHIRGGTK